MPPLEDMSELIQQVDALRELKKAQEPHVRVNKVLCSVKIVLQFYVMQ